MINDDQVIEYIENSTNIKFSDEQRDILTNHGGMCILASAGSGKTSTLINLIAKRHLTQEIAEPDKLLCTTYSKAGASEMDSRLSELFHKLNIPVKFSVKTMHSVYYQILTTFHYEISLVSNGERFNYIKSSISEALNVNRNSVSEETVSTVDGILSYQVNNLMSNDEIYNSYVFTLRAEISQEQYAKIRELYAKKKDEVRKQDFDDLQLIMHWLLVQSPYKDAAKNYCKSIFKYLYVDEAQDMSRIQFAIFKEMVSNPDDIIIIGDDDQCIYEWRGADPSIILNICGVYPQLMKKTLTTNYRCLSNIVEAADHGIHYNKIRSDKTMKPYRQGGDIKFCNSGYTNLYEMSKYPYAYIVDLVKNKNVDPKDIAVLCRNNNHLLVLSNMLFKDGIFCRTQENMRITKNFQFRNLSTIFKLGENTTNNHIVAENLWLIVPFLKKNVSREIGKLQGTYGISLRDVLGLVLTEYVGCNVGWRNPGYRLGSLDSQYYTAMFRYLRDEIVDSLMFAYNVLDSETTEDAICSFMSVYYTNQARGNNIDNDRIIGGLISYTTSLIKTMGYEKFKAYMRTVEQYEDGNMAIINSMVTFSTVHGAKGKEWKYVLIFGDDNVTFPSFRDIDNNKKSGVPDSDIRNMIDEGRRLHYVACTRAKEHLVIFSDPKNCSIYALETMGVADKFGIDDNSIIYMAQQHTVYHDLQNAADMELFSDKSQYKIDIDVKDISSNVGIKYEFEESKNVDTSLNINQIKTGSAVQNSDSTEDANF